VAGKSLDNRDGGLKQGNKEKEENFEQGNKKGI